MTRQTIDFGIDLGTTNSVISVANQGEIETIKNNNHDVTPSMVYVDKKGRQHVGNAAAQNLRRPSTAGDVQVEFNVPTIAGAALTAPEGDIGHAARAPSHCGRSRARE